ncbi:MAG: hypothetical protein LBK73_00275 [Treponema sp.]|nr:hypothetical protein [Treponema sp.]
MSSNVHKNSVNHAPRTRAPANLAGGAARSNAASVREAFDRIPPPPPHPMQ